MKAYGIGLTYDNQAVVNRTCYIQAINLSPGKFVVIPIATFLLDGLIMSVTQGALNVWLGDYSGDQLPTIPHLHYGPTRKPEQIWFPGMGKTIKSITVGAEGSVDPSLGCIILLGEAK